MARHEYTPGQDGAYSAEIYRLQMEQIRRDEERRKAMAELKEYKKPVDKAVGTVEHMLERQVRKAVTSDPLANEVRNVSIYGGFVASIAGGIALSVAAAAAEAANNRALERARDDLTSQQHNDYDNAYQERQVEQTKSLSDFKNEVAERSQMLESSTTAYYNEYKSVKEDATAAIAAENEAHEKRMREYDKQEREADNLAKIDRTRADEAYQNRISEIEKLPASERKEATRAAERERDSAYRDIDDKHAAQLSAINNNRDSSLEIRDKVIEHENNRINEAKQNYSDEIKAQKNSLSNAEVNLAKFESARDDAKDRELSIRDSKTLDGYTSKYDSARHFTDDELKLMDRVKADDDARKLARKTGTEYTPLVSDEERRQAHDLQRDHRYNGADRASAYEFTDAVDKTHKNVGHALATTLGTEREKELLKRVADDRAALKASEAGGEPYVPKVTNAERAEAKAIEKQYAGSLSSKKDIDNSIVKLSQASKSLDVEIGKASAVVGTHKENLEKINSSIASKQQQLSEINMANKALRTGKDENGTSLSAAKRSQLEAVVKNGPSAIQLQKDINGLKENQNAVKGQLKIANKELNNLQQTKNVTENHIGMLQRNKGAIADTRFDVMKQTTFSGAIKGMAADKAERTKAAASKKINNAIVAKGNSLRDNKTGLVALGGAAAAHIGRKNLENMDKKIDKKHKSKSAEKLQGKAGKMMKSSMKNIQREANRAIHQGNAVHKELFGTARKLSRVAQKYELALSVAAISLKVVKMPAAFATKCGRHAFRHIGGHTALGRKLAEAHKKRMMKIDAWKNGKGKGLVKAAHLGKLAGKGAFKTVLHAPTAVLKAPRAIIGTLTDPTILAKKAAQGAFRLTRKTTGIALKGANKVARFGGKMGRKAFNKTLGRTKLFKKMRAGRSSLLNKLKMSRIGRMFGGAKKKLLNFGTLLKKLRMKIAAWLASAFSSLLSALFTVLGYAMLGAIFVLIAYVVIMICSGVLTGVFNAIMNWLKSLTTEHKALVKNNPEFLMNCAVEYRNAELEILDMVRTGQNDPSSLPISTDPLLGGLSPLFNDFNSAADAEFNNRTNPKAQSNLNKILARFDVKEKDSQNRVTKEYVYNGDRTINTNFNIANSKYNSINIQYYTSEYLQRDANGRTKAALVANAVASPYEISNAKDALAIIDSLYTQKMETMQKMEALAYMGVGATQLGSFTNANQRGGSLFWNTHKVIYRNGTKPDHVWYHITEVGDTGNGNINGTLMYSNKEGTAQKAATDTTCDNKKTMTLNYTEYRYSYSKRHTNASTWDSTAYSSSVREYTTSSAISNRTTAGTSDDLIVPAALYYNANDTTSTSVTRSYSFRQDDGTTKTESKTFYVAKTNYDTGKALNKYHYSSNCDILKFYKVKNNNNRYAITDKDGYYIGTIDITYKSALETMINRFSVNPSDGGTTTIEQYANSAEYYLDYFWLKWDASKGCYGFNIVTTESSTYFNKDSHTLEEMQSAVNWGYTTLVANIVDYLDTTKISLTSCSHTEKDTVEIPHTTKLHVCLGHIDLDVAIGVISGCERSDGNENNDMFMEAMYVEGLEEDTKNSGFLGIYTKDKENEVSGWGSITYKAFHPDEDWAPNSELRQAARLKTRNTLTYGAAGVEIEYQCDDGDCINCVHHDNGTTGGRTKFQTLRIMPTDEMGFGFVFGGKVFYQTSMVSGEQRNIDCYLYSGGNLTKKNIDLLVPEGSAPSIRYNTPR